MLFVDFSLIKASDEKDNIYMEVQVYRFAFVHLFISKGLCLP